MIIESKRIEENNLKNNAVFFLFFFFFLKTYHEGLAVTKQSSRSQSEAVTGAIQ